MEINYGLDVVKGSLHVIKESNNIVKDVVKGMGDVVKEKANGICAEGSFLRNAKGR